MSNFLLGDIVNKDADGVSAIEITSSGAIVEVKLVGTFEFDISVDYEGVF